MVSEQELLPCPFCGSAPLVDEWFKGSRFIYCPNDECFVQPETGTFKRLSDATRKWNTRAIKDTTSGGE